MESNARNLPANTDTVIMSRPCDRLAFLFLFDDFHAFKNNDLSGHFAKVLHSPTRSL